MLKKYFIWLYRFSLIALAAMLLVMSVSIIALRYFILPNIAQYQADIVQAISQTLGQKVEIGSIQASWQGLNPSIRLSQVDIYDQQNRVALSLKQIDSTLSWWSIPLLEPRLGKLIIYQPELNIRREADGQIFIAGISLSGPSQDAFPNWLLRQNEILVIDADVIWQDALRQAPEIRLTQLNLKIENPAWDSLRGHHRFALKALPSAVSQQMIDIRGNLFGRKVSDWQHWHGKLYADIQQAELSEIKQWIDLPLMIHAGFGDSRVWLSFDDAAIERVAGQVDIQQLSAQLPYQSQPTQLNRLAGKLLWEQRRNGQWIEASNLQLLTPEQLNMKKGYFSLLQSQKNQQAYYQGKLSLDEFQLETVDKLIPYLPIDEQLANQIKQASPVGKLSNLYLEWRNTPQSIEHYALKTDFSDLGLEPIEQFDVPGFQHLTGNISMNEKSGVLQLNSQHITLYMKQVLRYGLPVDYLRGKVIWRHEQDKFNVHLSKLELGTPHTAGEVEGYINYDERNGAAFDLTSNFPHADVKFSKLYLPYILSKEVLDWIDTSVLDGQAEDVRMVLKGKLADFPFVDNRKGIFRITGKAHDVILDYATGWPMLSAVKMNMLFEGKRMELFISEAKSLNNKISNTKITIPDLLVAENDLDIKGEVSGNLQDQLLFANTSPINAWLGGASQGLRASGTGKLLMQVHIPLYHQENSKYSGKYSLQNASLSADNLPELTQINGDINLADGVLSSQNLRLNLFDAPVQIAMNTDKAKTVQISARGKINEAGLRRALGITLANSISGSTDWQGRASISDKRLEFSINSNLQGLALQLPAPLNKAANESMSFSLERKYTAANQDLIQFNLGNAINGKFARSLQNGVGKIDKGEIGVNVVAEIPSQKAFNLKAQLNHLDLDDWLVLFEKPDGQKDNAVKLPFDHLDISADSFDLFDKRLNNFKLSAQLNANAWLLGLNSDEIKGSVRWVPQGAGKILANLSQLTWPQDTPDKRQRDKTIKQLDMKYPDLDINAENFELNKKKFGRLELVAREQNGNWMINRLLLKNPDGVLNANGQWNNWKSKQTTAMYFNWQISDIGKTFKRLNYADTIKGGNAQLSGQLSWAGSPHEFDLPNLAGSLQLEANKGQILKVEPGVGRLFSVISLQNLPRRLTLDFKDLFSSGFVFDKITADIDIKQGIMRSNNFKMEGPTAGVEIKGETDLDKETQHLYVKVRPYITDALSLAAFAGGPAVGAAAYIAQKVLKNPLDKIAESEYEIVGTWSNPLEIDDKPAPVKPPSGIVR